MWWQNAAVGWTGLGKHETAGKTTKTRAQASGRTDLLAEQTHQNKTGSELQNIQNYHDLTSAVKETFTCSLHMTIHNFYVSPEQNATHSGRKGKLLHLLNYRQRGRNPMMLQSACILGTEGSECCFRMEEYNTAILHVLLTPQGLYL